MLDQQNSQSYLYKTPIEEIRALINARVPLIWVVTHEEDRFIFDLHKEILSNSNRKSFIWSLTQGLAEPHEYKFGEPASGSLGGSERPNDLIQHMSSMEIEDDEEGIVFVLRDLHICLQDAVSRRFRDLYEKFAYEGRTAIIVAPVLAHGPGGSKSGLPPILEKQVAVVNYKLPTLEQIIQAVKTVIRQIYAECPNPEESDIKLEYTEQEYKELAMALRGLSMMEVSNSISTCLAHLKRLDPYKLLHDKKSIIQRSNILEYIEPSTTLDDIGGLDVLKKYINRYALVHTEEAESFGVEPLKGIILAGIPGTGKSASAKAVGHAWKQPICRLNLGRVMHHLQGASEQRIQIVIDTVEKLAPCILWIDEVEKGLSGTKSSGQLDSGTLNRVFATLLTSMEEGMEGVTIIATANNIETLPPEFLRRFNEIFFVGLPSYRDRQSIFEIHLAKRGRSLLFFEDHLRDILTFSEGFTGAEIEKCIKDAIARAFYEGAKDLTGQHLVDSIKDTRPISVVQSEEIEALQAWAKTHARFASSQDVEPSKKSNSMLSDLGTTPRIRRKGLRS